MLHCEKRCEVAKEFASEMKYSSPPFVYSVYCSPSSFFGGLDHISRKLYIFLVTSHNFFPLSSVQIIIIPACCLLCVL